MKKFYLVSGLLTAALCYGGAVKADHFSNGWENIVQKTDQGTICRLATKNLPFTLTLAKEKNAFALFLDNPSWGMGMDVRPQVTLQAGAYQKNFVFEPSHLTEMKAVLPQAEMLKLEAAFSNAQTASIAFNGMDPNEISLQDFGGKLSAFQSCAPS